MYGSLMKRNKISYNFYRLTIAIHPPLSRGMDNTIFLGLDIKKNYTVNELLDWRPSGEEE